jgi:hypothetical protein
MSNLHNERYDEIKSLLKKSKLLFEQDGQINVAKDVESRIQQDVEYDTAETEVEVVKIQLQRTNHKNTEFLVVS